MATYVPITKCKLVEASVSKAPTYWWLTNWKVHACMVFEQWVTMGKPGHKSCIDWSHHMHTYCTKLEIDDVHETFSHTVHDNLQGNECP